MVYMLLISEEAARRQAVVTRERESGRSFWQAFLDRVLPPGDRPPAESLGGDPL